MSAPAEPRGSQLGPELLRAWPLPVDHNGDKLTRGTVLVVGGSELTAGAVLLAGLAALRMGAGRLQLATAASAAPALTVAAPEALVLPLRTGPTGSVRIPEAPPELARRLEHADVVLIGPGMLGRDDIAEALGTVVDRLGPTTRLVVDAGALPSLAEVDEARVRPLAGRLLLTPNASELERLAGEPCTPERLPALVSAVARRFGAAVSSFGEVAGGDGRCWCRGPGCPGLGTSGSGDVLAGLVAGAAARGGDACRAACWGTYVHGAAGVRLAERLGSVSFLARELLDEVPLVVRSLEA